MDNTELKEEQVEIKESSNVNKFVTRLCNLLTVKSIITLALLFTFCILVLYKEQVPDELSSLLQIVVAFYFGTQIGGESKKS